VMGYIQLPSAILLGILFFNESPPVIAYLGCILIIFSGLMVLNSKSN
jgi:drug/metabolite transporter (DMT)-like permease